MVLTTLDEDGFPHSVPMGYFPFEGKLYLGCRRATRKVRNLLRDPRVSLYVDNGRAEKPHLVVSIQGTARLVESGAELERVRRASGREGALAEGVVYVEVTPVKMRCWEHG